MDVVATVTALAALLTALANSFVILEMRKQRTATTKPVLKLLSKYRKAIVKKESKTWEWENKESSHFTKLSLMNFGTGPSINLTAEWDISLDKLIDSLKYFDPYKQMTLRHENGFIELDNSFHSVDNQRRLYIEAVPISKSQNGTSIKLPSYYISAFEKFIQLGILDRPKGKSETATPVEIPDFPEAYVTLNFEDINGEKLSQKFEVTLSFSSISPSDEGFEIDASFSVKEVSSV